MKRTIALLCAALLCFGLAACGKNKKPAPAINNGGQYVSYGGTVYYWKYNAACIESSGVWGEFSDVPGASRNMARLGADGSEGLVFDADGYGGIWIHNDRFYLTRLDERGFPYIFSTSMTGGDRREIGPGEIFALDEAKNLLIATQRRDGGIFTYDTNAQAKEALPNMHAELLFYDAPSATLYYRDCSIGEYNAVKLCSIDLEAKSVRDVARIEFGDYDGLEEAQWAEFGNAWLDGDSLHVFIAGYGGTARMYYGSAALVIDIAGDGVQLNENPGESDWFGVNRPFSSNSEGPFQGSGGDCFGWYICPGDDGAPEIVLTEEELAALGLPGGPYMHDDAFAAVRDVDYADGALFFTIWQGPRNEAEDIGWREAYGFGGMQVYCKDVATGQIKELYSVNASESFANP